MSDVGLPVRPFFYTIDQIAYLLQIDEKMVKLHYLHYEGRSTGICPSDRMVATNISPAGIKPDWRILERHLIRWMKFKGYKYHERGYVK